MKNLFKRILPIILVIAMCFTFVACGGGGDDTGDEPGFIDSVSLAAKLKVLSMNVGKIKTNAGLDLFELALNEVLASYDVVADDVTTEAPVVDPSDVPVVDATEENVVDTNTEAPDVTVTDEPAGNETTEAPVVDTSENTDAAEVDPVETDATTETVIDPVETDTVLRANMYDFLSSTTTEAVENTEDSTEEVTEKTEEETALDESKTDAFKERVRKIKARINSIMTGADSDYLGTVVSNVLAMEKIEDADLRNALTKIVLTVEGADFDAFVAFVENLIDVENKAILGNNVAEYAYECDYAVGARLNYCVKRVTLLRTVDSINAVIAYLYTR